jgi:hypothetical protein
VYGTSEYEVLDIDESRSTHDPDDDGADDTTKENMLGDESVDKRGCGGKLVTSKEPIWTFFKRPNDVDVLPG